MRFPAFLGLSALIVISLGAATGCLNSSSGAAAAQEGARELTTNLRFGRMEMVMEHVSASEASVYLATHKSWGNSIRIADVELSGLRMASKDEAIITVAVSWYEPSTQELRNTVLRQTWKDLKGGWLLTAEARADGDIGLLGEPRPAAAPEAPHHNAQFETVHLD
ncbi:MAG: hypothetical protein ABI183_02285 [Polyangiaceae bacterium]